MGPALTRRHTKINILLEGGALDRAQMDYGPVHCKYLECLFEMRGKQTIIESVGLHFQSIEVRVCAYDARLFICWKYLHATINAERAAGKGKTKQREAGKSSCVFSYESDGDKTMQEMAVRRRSKYATNSQNAILCQEECRHNSQHRKKGRRNARGKEAITIKNKRMQN
jgi:hypothetical protein